MSELRYFSTFSGIGGFERGIEKAFGVHQSLSENEQTQQRRDGDIDENGDLPLSRINAPLCVGYSEIDKYASAIYKYHYPEHRNYGDITAISEHELPDFELFVGGFPCQAFSIAGKRQGFEDTRGTLFFDVARILAAKRPELFLLENVKGLLNHDGGRTIATIYRVLTELGYTVGWEVVNSCHFGVPQNRERIFIIGHLGDRSIREIFPIGKNGKLLEQENESREGRPQTELSTTVRDGIGSKADGTFVVVNKKGEKKNQQNLAATLTGGGHSGGNHSDMDLLVGTWRTHKDGQGFREIESGLSPSIPARAREDGSVQPVVKQLNLSKESGGKQPYQQNRVYDSNGLSPTIDQAAGRWQVNTERIRRLTPTECERLQGFPDGWTSFGDFEGATKEISDTQRYKCLGNAVTVNVIESVMKSIFAL